MDRGVSDAAGDEDANLLAAIFNDLKSDFLSVRSLVWDARNDPGEDAGQYRGQLPGSGSAGNSALLRLALVGAMSVVDRCSLIWAIRAGINDDRLDARRVWDVPREARRTVAL